MLPLVNGSGVADHVPPKCIYLWARNGAADWHVLAEVKHINPKAKPVIILLDLAYFKSLRNTAEAFKARAHRFYLLLLNADVPFLPSQDHKGL